MKGVISLSNESEILKSLDNVDMEAKKIKLMS
jgi:hypothetical protein